MIPSIDDSIASFVTMINGALIQDIEKKSIETFYLLFSQTKLYPYYWGKFYQPFAPFSLAHFKS